MKEQIIFTGAIICSQIWSARITKNEKFATVMQLAWLVLAVIVVIF